MDPLPPARSANVGRLYVINDAHGPSGWLPLELLIDGVRACEIRAGQYAAVDLPSGPHRIMMGAVDVPGDFEVRAGESVYIHPAIPADISEKAHLVTMSGDDAKRFMSTAKRVETTLPAR
jgi:hypothetical protein